MIDLCHLIVLMYVTIDGFSYTNSNENRFDPMLTQSMDEIVLDIPYYQDSYLRAHKVKYIL